MLVEKKKQHSE